MTMPNTPPDTEIPSQDPPDGPTPSDATPDEPGWQAPGADEGSNAPMRMPRDNPDVETEL